MSQVRVVNHPLVQDRLTRLRDKTTQHGNFREAMSSIAYLLYYEAMQNAPTIKTQIETPLAPLTAESLAPNIVLVAILRAGLGFLDGILHHAPEARVGYLGLKRDPMTLEAISYYSNLPNIDVNDSIFVLDPMLATGHTAVAALKTLQETGVKSIHLISLLASPQGIETVTNAFPDIKITVAAIDPILDQRGYILPGLGDAGDRLYGTMGH
ncbi:MAG: uracil phosphoribosyltransferase [Proteobacteria bacterium]|nr:MAG: uracil phosphoribosyltransferase [Pseudomonadota bacterium]